MAGPSLVLVHDGRERCAVAGTLSYHAWVHALRLYVRKRECCVDDYRVNPLLLTVTLAVAGEQRRSHVEDVASRSLDGIRDHLVQGISPTVDPLRVGIVDGHRLGHDALELARRTRRCCVLGLVRAKEAWVSGDEDLRVRCGQSDALVYVFERLDFSAVFRNARCRASQGS